MARIRPRWRLFLALLTASTLLSGGVVWMHASGATADGLMETLRGWLFKPGIPAGLAMANGRIEATEVDVATKLAGRLIEVRVQEGDRVEAGEVLAVLDTESLEAQQRQAAAELRRARQEREYARAVEAQQECELALAQRDLARLERLAQREQFVSEEQIDQARTRVRSAEAAARASTVRVGVSAEAIESAQASLERIGVDIADSHLKAPRAGRVLYRLAEPGEVLGPGGKVLTLLDLADVYMIVFLPTATAGGLALGTSARIFLDAALGFVIPASVSFVAARAQFTPKQVETQRVRENLSFRVKVRIDPALLVRYEPLVKAGLPGVAYIKVAPDAVWPPTLMPRLPSWPNPSSD